MEDGTIRNASGTLRIDQRTGLSALMERGYKDEIKAIICYNESRLFRDEWQIQVDTFIKACHDHDVRVITPTYHYDFRHNKFDIEQFRMQAKIAADYIKNHVKGLLHPARNRKSARGLCVAGSVPVCFFVDLEKKKDTYPKYKPYELHPPLNKDNFCKYRELRCEFDEVWKKITP